MMLCESVTVIFELDSADDRISDALESFCGLICRRFMYTKAFKVLN
jgi:hypothetical protein